MDRSRLRDQLLRHTSETLDRFGRDSGDPKRGGRAPQPGDLFVFEETADFDVQWAVLERRPRDGRLLVVPADVHPLVGSADVAVAAEAPVGAMTLRCRFGVWLDDEALAPEGRTGSLPPADLERARSKRAEIDRGALHGSALERETDTESEYLDWAQEVLVKAQQALSELGEEAAERRVYANGIYGHSGEYLVPPADAAQVAAWARGETIEPNVLRLLEHVGHLAGAHLGGLVDPGDVGQSGWGIVFHGDESPAVRDALAPLIEHRRGRAGARTRVLEHRAGEDWLEWLARYDVGADEVRPEKVPHYLLLVGPPTRIPYAFQERLGVQYAVGRLSFEAPGDYRRYAESLVDAERRAEPPQAREAVSFAPRHGADPLTRWTADVLVRSLVGDSGEEPGVAEEQGYADTRLWRDDATKARLAEVLHGRGAAQPPALLFCAGHGLAWPRRHYEQTDAQGALLCQDWPGAGRMEPGHYFCAHDLTDAARLHGMVAVLLASYSAGTPERDFHTGEPAPRIADEPFVARLPQRLLAHPRGGALAVVGLVSRTWSPVTASAASRELAQALRSALGRILAGRPVGHVVRELRQREAARTIDLNALLNKMGFGARVAERKVAAAWLEREQVRGFVVLGDPAARLR